MALSKELALAVDFQKAPKELQKAAQEHYANMKSIMKLKAQLTESAVKLEEAEKVAAESEKTLTEALRSWEPDSASVKEKA